MNTVEFLQTVFGDNDFEIRLIEDGSPKVWGRDKHSYSFLKHGDRIYRGKEKKRGHLFKQEYLEEYINYYYNDVYDLMDMGVFFVVNSPDFDKMTSCTCSDSDIVHINAQFVDIDCTDHEIKSDEQKLEQWKYEVYQELINHKAKPSIMIRTKHGWHCLWLIDNGEVNKFRLIQQQLIKEFKGDKSCINVSHCLRLPNFCHRKDYDNPYCVGIKDSNGRRFTQEELRKLLPELAPSEIMEGIKAEREASPISVDDSSRKKIVDLVKEKLHFVKDDGKKLIIHCPMPNHEDSNPSAFFNKEYLWVHCSGCSSHIPLDELAELLGWDDVLEELNKPPYELDLKCHFDRIAEQMVKVNEISEFCLTLEEQKLRDSITEVIIAELNKREQYPNDLHKSYFADIVTILLKGQPSIMPDLIPLDIGAGKSTIIEVFVSEMARLDPNYGCIIVKERKDDVRSLVSNINNRLGYSVSVPVYGFEEGECLAGKKLCDNYRKQDFKGKQRVFETCNYSKECRYSNQYTKQSEYPVLVITHERFHYLNETDRLIRYFGYFDGRDGQQHPRTKLMVDEKPKLIVNEQLDSEWFKEKCRGIYYDENDEAFKELDKAISLVKSILEPSDTWRTAVEPIDPTFAFSEESWNRFEPFGDSFVGFMEIVESATKYGGHKLTQKGKVVLFTSHYCRNTYGDNFHTMIFDGTADIDLTYRHEDYRMFDFKPIRTYENFTMYQCDFLKSSKSALNNKSLIDAFCEQVRLISDDNPQSKLYVPVFKDHQDTIKANIKDLIDGGKVMVDHYGGTRGKNDYLDCDIVVVEGILHKTEDFYIALHRAVTGKQLDDLGCRYINKLRRFNSLEIETLKVADMNCDYSQEIKRSKQRDNTRNVHGKLYIFSSDKELLDILRYKFPNCKTEKWNPIRIIRNKIFDNGHPLGKNQLLVATYIEENATEYVITQEDITEFTGLDKSTVSKELNKPLMQGFLEVLGFEKVKDEHDQRKWNWVNKFSREDEGEDS